MTKHTLESKRRPINILLVEDNIGDVTLTKHAFEKSDVPVDIKVALDGDEALSMLHKKDEEYQDLPMPDLVLLDLNLPKLDGKSVLREVKSDTLLRRIPVVILSSSTNQHDITRSYDAGANCYLAKPESMGEYRDMVERIEQFWFGAVIVPDDEHWQAVS